MSDVGFYGLGAFLVGLGMLVLAGLGVLVEGLRWWKRGRARPLPVLLPIAYGALALVLLLLAEEGSVSTRRTLDGVSPVIAGLGLVLWAAVRFGLRERAAP